MSQFEEKKAHEYWQKNTGQLQAVILAISDCAELYPFTEKIPKALLPLGNLKLIDYPLHFLKKIGPSDIFILVYEKVEEQIREYIEQKHRGEKITVFPVPFGCDTAEALTHLIEAREGDPSSPSRPCSVRSPSSTRKTNKANKYDSDYEDAFFEDEEFLIDTDFIVMPCDLVMDFPVHELLYIHQAHDASAVVLLKAHQEDPKLKKKKGFVGKHICGLLDHQDKRAVVPGQRLLYLRAIAGLRNTDAVVINKALFLRYPEVVLNTHYENMQFAVMQPWILRLIRMKNFKSMDQEVMPYLVARQITNNLDILNLVPASTQTEAAKMSSNHHACPGLRPPILRPDPDEPLSPDERKPNSWSRNLNPSVPDLLWFSQMDSKELDRLRKLCKDKPASWLHENQNLISEEFKLPPERLAECIDYFTTLYNQSMALKEAWAVSTRGLQDNERDSDMDDPDDYDPIRTYAYNAQVKSVFRLVDDEMHGKTYLRISQAVKNPSLDFPEPFSVDLDALREANPSCKIDAGNLIGTDLKLGEDATLKQCTIGNFCKIGKGVKIVNSLLMDHVQIDSNCHISDCVIGNHSMIGEGCQLKRVLVEPTGQVEPNTSAEEDQL